jgi:hypothetical protein
LVWKVCSASRSGRRYFATYPTAVSTVASDLRGGGPGFGALPGRKKAVRHGYNPRTSLAASPSSSSSGNARKRSGTIGASVPAARIRTSPGPKGTSRIRRMTSKLPARSFSDWMSALPRSGSPGGAPPRSHFASNPWT